MKKMVLIVPIIFLALAGCSSNTKELADKTVKDVAANVEVLAKTAGNLIFGNTTKSKSKSSDSNANSNPRIITPEEQRNDPVRIARGKEYAQPTGLPIADAVESPHKIKGYFFNMTEQAFIDNYVARDTRGYAGIKNRVCKIDEQNYNYWDSMCKFQYNEAAKAYFFTGRAKVIEISTSSNSDEVNILALKQKFGEPTDKNSGKSYVWRDKSNHYITGAGQLAGELYWNLEDTHGISILYKKADGGHFGNNSQLTIFSLTTNDLIDQIEKQDKVKQAEQAKTALD